MRRAIEGFAEKQEEDVPLVRRMVGKGLVPRFDKRLQEFGAKTTHPGLGVYFTSTLEERFGKLKAPSL